MHTQEVASPDEFASQNYFSLLKNGLAALAICFLFLSFSGTHAVGATRESPQPKKSLKKVTRSSPTANTQSKTKNKVKTAAKSTVKNGAVPAQKTKSGKGAKVAVKQVTKAAVKSEALARTPSRNGKKNGKVVQPSSKARPRTNSSPLISSATRIKGQSIAMRIGNHLPDGLKKEVDELLGIRYRLGGQGQSGYDCSGLVQKVYADAFGIALPSSSQKLYKECKLSQVGKEELRTGDLLFFGPQRKHVNHVGIYLAGGYFFHAARSEGVTITRLDNGYWQSRWMGSKRVPNLDLHKDGLGRGLAHNMKSLKMDSVDHGYARDATRRNSVQKVGYVDGGIQLSEATRFEVSGFAVNAFEQHPGSAVRWRGAAAADPHGDELQRGLRLSAAISPTQWFKLIPSITHYSDGAAAAERQGDYQRLGLETWMAPPSSRVALFMAASAKNFGDLLDRPLNVSPDWESLNLALGIHYQFSDSLQFSLKGTRYHSLQSLENHALHQSRKMQDDVSLNLNFLF